MGDCVDVWVSLFLCKASRTVGKTICVGLLMSRLCEVSARQLKKSNSHIHETILDTSYIHCYVISLVWAKLYSSAVADVPSDRENTFFFLNVFWASERHNMQHHVLMAQTPSPAVE